ncbi:bactofilin family protein [Virgifigura deserti]|uniref:bactofilin family protein n=1 Tax=Virgifigura deserti TaxID=2268457 RepID=UPI003CCC0F97
MAAAQQSGGANIPDRRALEAEAAAEQAAKRLLVGRGIKLNGELQRCDTLIVEGHVDALLKEGRVIEIAECGSFKGTAAVDEADIGGRLEGDLTVRQRLTIRATGRVEGTVRYGELAIEAGGVLVGPIELLQAGAKAAGAGGSATGSATAPDAQATRPTTQTP